MQMQQDYFQKVTEEYTSRSHREFDFVKKVPSVDSYKHLDTLFSFLLCFLLTLVESIDLLVD